MGMDESGLLPHLAYRKRYKGSFPHIKIKVVYQDVLGNVLKAKE